MKNRWIGFGWMGLCLFACLGLVAGCPSATGGGEGEGEPEECAAEGEACTANEDCCEGLVCGEDGTCVEAPVDLCEGVECEEGFECDPETGECVETVVDLCEGVECDEGFECNPETGECEAGAEERLHEKLFTDNLDDPNYQGTQTCLTCHSNHATDILETAHWNWSGPADNIAGLEGEPHGKVDLVNDY